MLYHMPIIPPYNTCVRSLKYSNRFVQLDNKVYRLYNKANVCTKIKIC